MLYILMLKSWQSLLPIIQSLACAAYKAKFTCPDLLMLHIQSHAGPEGQQQTANVSQTAYYAYRLQQRTLEANAALLWSGRLLQQYAVDAWASIEQTKLNWVRSNQWKIRAEVYQGVVDAAAGDEQLLSKDVVLFFPHLI